MLRSNTVYISELSDNIHRDHAGSVQDECSIAMGSYTDKNTGQIVDVGACFIAGTKIQSPNGEKNIEDIQEGDQVYSCNAETGETGVKEVKNTFVREVNTLVHVFVGDNNSKEEAIDA